MIIIEYSYIIGDGWRDKVLSKRGINKITSQIPPNHGYLRQENTPVIWHVAISVRQSG